LTPTITALRACAIVPEVEQYEIASSYMTSSPSAQLLLKNQTNEEQHNTEKELHRSQFVSR